MSIANSKILVVGGGSGMGLALAELCLADGAEVIVTGRNPERLQSAAEHLGNPGRLRTLTADITREKDVADLFAKTGRLDHIVSTAADIEGAYELLPALDMRAAERVVASKFYGPLLLAKHGAPALGDGGSITYTSGIAAYR